MESRTQGSWPRSQKKNPRPRTALPRTDHLEAKDRNARGQGQGPRTQEQVFSEKKNFVFSGDLQKKGFQKNFVLMLELRSRGFYGQAYAVDLAALFTGADMLWIRGMALKTINIAANWASEQELRFSSKKTEVVLFTHKRNPDLGFLLMNVSNLKLFKEARLLGIILDIKLTWKSHITRITRKASTALMQCR